MARFPECRSFVQAVLDAVGRAGMAAVDMRYFAARPGAPAEYCRRRVRECDVVVVVIGFCYGTTVPGEMVSYAELEFTEAAAAGVPALVFLLGEDAGVPGVPADADHGRVRRFRQRLREAGMLVREFSTDAGLELEVFHALRDLQGSGRRAGMRYSLPPDTAAFTGRDAELGRITTAAARAARPGGVAICAIGGMPGVGKTALAVHAARLLRDRFPDGQLFADLHAHTPGQEPVLPAAALAGLLAATGLDPRYLPGSLEDRAGLWRERMAGKRAVLVLDNAASTAQVTPLLPGGDVLVLVTSRRRLGDLPGAVTPVFLSALPPGEAVQMFIRLAPRAAHAPGGAVAEVAGLAGFLPLAISLLARVYAGHPSWTLADLAAETRAAALAMTAEHQTIAAAFGASYRQLRPGRQRFFRLLGLHPGATTDACAAAALAGTGLAAAAGHLDALHREGLLTETGYRRYGMHDLIRRYARGHAAPGSVASRDRALERLFGYYQRTAARAEAVLARQARPGPAPAAPLPAVPVLGDAGQALAWVRAERVSLLACLDHAAAAAQHARVIALTAALAALWRWDGPWAEAIARHTAAVQAAQHLGDRLSHRGRAAAGR